MLLDRNVFFFHFNFFVFYFMQVPAFVGNGSNGVFEMWSNVKENVHLVHLKGMTDLVKQMIQHLSSWQKKKRNATSV